jgi:hypothetical protein
MRGKGSMLMCSDSSSCVRLKISTILCKSWNWPNYMETHSAESHTEHFNYNTHRIHVHVSVSVSVSDVCIPLVTEVKSSLELNKVWHTTMEQRSCASKRSNKKSKFSRKILFMRCPNRKAKSIVRPKSCHHSTKPLSLPLKKWHQYITHVEPECPDYLAGIPEIWKVGLG